MVDSSRAVDTGREELALQGKGQGGPGAPGPGYEPGGDRCSWLNTKMIKSCLLSSYSKT